MSKRGMNEGFRVLDDFVCEAVHAPEIPYADPGKQGRNAGIHVVQEISLDSPSGIQLSEKTPVQVEPTSFEPWGRIARHIALAACIAVASGLGSYFGGWIGASIAAIIPFILFFGKTELV